MITIKQSALEGPIFLLAITSFLLACSNNTDNTSAASNTDTSVAVYG